MNPRIVVIAGPLKGTTFPILQEVDLAFGRHPASHAYLEDDLVSRRHCSLRLQDGRVQLKDLESMNGTTVNGVPIQLAVLEHGDRIKIGSSKFIYFDREETADNIPEFTDQDALFTTHLTLRLGLDDAQYLAPETIEDLPSTSRLARDLGALLRISSSINAIRDPEQVQSSLLRLVLEVIPAERAAILLVGHKGDDFVSGQYFERDLEIPSAFRVSRSITHQVLNEGVAVLRNNVLTGGAVQPSESLVAQQIHSVLCVPLIVFETRLGVIYVDSADSAAGFDADHLQLLTAIAGIAAVALEHARYVAWLEGENQRLQEEISVEHDMIGDGPRIQQVYQFIGRVAPTGSTVLILGESGTGKELVARAIHRNGNCANGPFVALNCGAIVDSLLESELFGHEKGAFTGAVAQRKGKIEMANGGTLFLDEVGELPLQTQVALLRVLQQREFERVGGNRPIKVDVRIIAATNRNLEQAIRDGRFRQDLFYRLKVVSIEMPPLSARGEDIPLLASHFLRKYRHLANRALAGITPEAMRLLVNHDWPGNVRELENAMERAVVLGASDYILPEDLPESLLERKPDNESVGAGYHATLNSAKKELIHRAYRESGGNYTEAARILDLHPNYLHRLIRNLDMKSDLK